MRPQEETAHTCRPRPSLKVGISFLQEMVEMSTSDGRRHFTDFTPSKICSYGRVAVVLEVPSPRRTPNPDHKGTNTIGREVREEIG